MKTKMQAQNNFHSVPSQKQKTDSPMSIAVNELTTKKSIDQIITIASKVYQSKPATKPAFKPIYNITSNPKSPNLTPLPRFFSPEFKTLQAKFENELSTFNLKQTAKDNASRAFIKTLKANLEKPQTPEALKETFIEHLNFFKECTKAIKLAHRIEQEEYLMSRNEQPR